MLKDAQGKTIKVASAEIDRLVPQTLLADARAVAA